MNNTIMNELKELNISLTDCNIPSCYCDNCNKRVKYDIYEDYCEAVLNNIKIKYKKKIAKCKKCRNEVFPNEINDENVRAANNEYRKQANIITIEEIKKLLEKYDIGAVVLSELLGWGKITIQRYKEGRMPTKKYSDILLRLLSDCKYMESIVEENKNKISGVAYRKVINAIQSLNEIGIDKCKKDKLNLVANYILKYEFSNKELQKLLYYIQGFSIAFKGEPIFYDLPEACVHGPIYRKIYNEYEKFGYNPVEPIKLEENLLDIEETTLIDSVLKYFGVFTANKLENITHHERPWLKSRAGLERDAPSNKEIDYEDIKSYFIEVKNKYQMLNYSDIRAYALEQI